MHHCVNELITILKINAIKILTEMQLLQPQKATPCVKTHHMKYRPLK